MASLGCFKSSGPNLPLHIRIDFAELESQNSQSQPASHTDCFRLLTIESELGSSKSFHKYHNMIFWKSTPCPVVTDKRNNALFYESPENIDIASDRLYLAISSGKTGMCV